ncbi:MAG: CPBP family intramembrane glutamic endopeptidase [Bacillota bacterium]
MYVYAVFFSPIFEELICRKVIQDKLNKHIQNNISLVISAVIFAALHFNLANFAGYFFIGIVWGYYYRKTNNIFVPIMSHFLFNYLALLIQSF